MKTAIRPAQPAHASLLAALLAGVWPAERADAAQIAYTLAQPGHVAHIAYVAGQPAGFVSCFPTTAADDTPRWEIDLLAVAPPFRRRGLARALVAAALDAGAIAGARLARALTRRENRAVHVVFDQCGFTCDGRLWTLYVGNVRAPRPATLPPGAHLVPVDTFTYSGRWLEGRVDTAALRVAITLPPAEPDVIGCLLPAEREDLHVAAYELGYSRLGRYYWWVR